VATLAPRFFCSPLLILLPPLFGIMGGIGVDYSDGRFDGGAGEQRGHGMHGIFCLVFGLCIGFPPSFVPM